MLDAICDAIMTAILAIDTADAVPMQMLPPDDDRDLEIVATQATRIVRVLPSGSARAKSGTVLDVGPLAHDIVVDITYARADFISVPQMLAAAAEDARRVSGAIRPPTAWADVANAVYVDPVTQRIDVYPRDGGGIVGTIMQIRLSAEWGSE